METATKPGHRHAVSLIQRHNHAQRPQEEQTTGVSFDSKHKIEFYCSDDQKTGQSFAGAVGQVLPDIRDQTTRPAWGKAHPMESAYTKRRPELELSNCVITTCTAQLRLNVGLLLLWNT